MRSFFSERRGGRWILLCAVLTICMLLAAEVCALAEENLLINGDFSDVEDGEPVGWVQEMWHTESSVSALSVSEDGYDGNCILVENFSANDARYVQTVAVEPDTLYRIACMCRAEGIGADGTGATISIGNTFCYSEALTDTDGEWQRIELYGRTGPDQTELTLFARVGGYSSENSGRAWFDDFEMTQVDEVPSDFEEEDFTPISQRQSASVVSEEDEVPERNTEAFVLLTCVYLLVILAVARKHRRAPERSAAYYGRLMILMMAGALILRLILAARIPGYNTDINCFTRWAEQMAAVGPAEFYRSGIWCDYPPLYIWMLAPIGALETALRLTFRSGAQLILVKLWPILFDLAAAWLIWRRARKVLGSRAALLLAAFFAFNPAVFTDSAAWGQIDSVFTLLIALCALWAMEERYVPSLVSFALAMLIKPQSLLFAPIGLFAILVQRIRADENPRRAMIWTAATALSAGATLLCGMMGASLVVTGLFGLLCAALIVLVIAYAWGKCREPAARPLRNLILGLLAALGLIYLVALVSSFDASQGVWTMLTSPVSWLKDLYAQTMSGNGASYDKVTINALNVFYLFDLNWQDLGAHPVASAFAWICFAGSYLYCAALCALSKDKRHLPLIGGVLIMLIFSFGPMIHERYVFPAILLLLLGYIYARDKRVLISLALLSAALFLNEVLVLQGGMTAYNGGHLQSSENWINYIVSFLGTVNTLFMAWTALDICVLGHVYPLRGCEVEAHTPGERDLLTERDHKLHLRRIDAILMGAMTLIYGIVAFTNLGSTKAPQTMWTSGSAGEQIVFDLGETQRFRMTYYGSIYDAPYTSGNFTVEFSDDGVHWSTPYYAKYNQGEIFRWLWYVPLDADDTQASGLSGNSGSVPVAFAGDDGESYPYQTARYVRIASVSAGLNLNEVGFLDEDGEPLPIAGLEQFGDNVLSDAAMLIDEQDTIPDHPSYYNSSYFDEIYHARTAYEHLHGLKTYEWTHPPLGKVLMMVGVQIFGMTPFGWRFMGALMGVLMVPLMYLLVQQLFKSTKLSFIAMFLLTVDAMHFTQTRIATIDSYAVFWIMLMYLFMFRYCQTQWHTRRDFYRSLIPLGLCGVTMGIAWATKWIGLYASAGLAVLFFWSLWQRWREYRCALECRDSSRAALCDGVVETFWTGLVVTIAFCLVFFILIPVLIYYFSYFWHLRGQGMTSFAEMFTADRVRTVIDLQKSIFNYHAGLGGDTHYFRSPWYQWPIIWWPMWYYNGTPFIADGMISSISCMGNPAVWWFGLAALIFVLVHICSVRRAPRSYTMVVVGFASQFLPWVLVPRSTFIYHYFASVPFLIMTSVLMLKWVRSKSRTAFCALSIALMALALMLFIAFYPLESGLPVARSYAQYLRWFKWYNF